MFGHVGQQLLRCCLIKYVNTPLKRWRWDQLKSFLVHFALCHCVKIIVLPNSSWISVFALTTTTKRCQMNISHTGQHVRPATRNAQQCPRCHLMCQAANVTATTSHSHFYKAANMWCLPCPVSPEVNVNLWPWRGPASSEVRQFWFLVLMPSGSGNCYQVDFYAHRNIESNFAWNEDVYLWSCNQKNPSIVLQSSSCL